MFLSGITIVLPSPSQAYELRTHAEITRQAFTASQGISTYLSNLAIRDELTRLI